MAHGLIPEGTKYQNQLSTTPNFLKSYCVSLNSRNIINLDQSMDSGHSININVGKSIHLYPNTDNKIRIQEENEIVELKYKISPWIITNIMKIKGQDFKITRPKILVPKEQTQMLKLKQEINVLRKDIALMSANIKQGKNKRNM